MTRIHDRAAAGRLLAPRVSRQPLDDPVVIGIGAGGGAVGAEIARYLGCPLDVLDVRELDVGDSLHPRRAFGALSGRGHILVHPGDLEHVPAGREAVRRAVEQAQAAQAPAAGVTGRRGGAVPTSWRTLVLVDDGSSSRHILAAALDLVRAGRPGRVVLAVPTATQDVIDDLARIAGDVVVAVVAPWTEWFGWHGRIYDDDALPDREELGELLAG